MSSARFASSAHFAGCILFARCLAASFAASSFALSSWEKHSGVHSKHMDILLPIIEKYSIKDMSHLIELISVIRHEISEECYLELKDASSKRRFLDHPTLSQQEIDRRRRERMERQAMQDTRGAKRKK